MARMSAASCGSLSSLRRRPRAAKSSRHRIPRCASWSPLATVSRPQPKRRSAWRGLPSQSCRGDLGDERHGGGSRSAVGPPNGSRRRAVPWRCPSRAILPGEETMEACHNLAGFDRAEKPSSLGKLSPAGRLTSPTCRSPGQAPRTSADWSRRAWWPTVRSRLWSRAGSRGCWSVSVMPPIEPDAAWLARRDVGRAGGHRHRQRRAVRGPAPLQRRAEGRLRLHDRGLVAGAGPARPRNRGA